MRITTKEAREFILDDINKTYMDITDFEITNAIYNSTNDLWKIEVSFNYKITNRINGIKFRYTISNRNTDEIEIFSNDFKPKII